MAFVASSARRPNRSAAERRAQQHRSSARMLNQLLKLQAANMHRGSGQLPHLNASATALRDSLDDGAVLPYRPPANQRMKKYSFRRSSPVSTVHEPIPSYIGSFFDLHTALISLKADLEQNLSVLHGRVDDLSRHIYLIEQHMAILTAPSGDSLAGQHSIDELLDEKAINLIRDMQQNSADNTTPATELPAAADQAEKLVVDTSEPSSDLVPAPDISAPAVWWQCEECSFKILSRSSHRPQRKFQHLKSHRPAYKKKGPIQSSEEQSDVELGIAAPSLSASSSHDGGIGSSTGDVSSSLPGRFREQKKRHD